jgi:hypothetical protein
MSGDQTAKPNAGVAGQTAFLAQHKRRPTAMLDGIAAWLRDEIEYLEAIRRTEHGDGALSAYKATLKEVETVDAQ